MSELVIQKLAETIIHEIRHKYQFDQGIIKEKIMSDFLNNQNLFAMANMAFMIIPTLMIGNKHTQNMEKDAFDTAYKKAKVIADAINIDENVLASLIESETNQFG